MLVIPAVDVKDEDVDFFAIFLASAARVADHGDPCVSSAELSVDDFEKFLLVAPAVDVEDEDVDFFTIFLASAARVADDEDPCVSSAELSATNKLNKLNSFYFCRCIYFILAS